MLMFCLSSASVFANNIAIYEGYVTPSNSIKNLKKSPDAIVLQDISNNNGELVVFYRYGDDQQAGFSVATYLDNSAELNWTNSGTFTDGDIFKTSSIAPAPIELNNKLYLFGIKHTDRDIIYNSFSSVENLLSGTWDNSKFLNTGKEASGLDGRNTISLAAYENDMMMSFYAYPQPTTEVFSSSLCLVDDTLNCKGVNTKSGDGYNDPTLIATTIDSNGDDRTLLFVRDEDDQVVHLHEYKLWPDENEMRWKDLYVINNSLDQFSGAVFSSVQHDGILYLFFKNAKGNIAQMNISVDDLDTRAWTYPVEIKDTSGAVIGDVEGGLKAVVYKNHTYVFYLDKKEQKLKYFAL